MRVGIREMQCSIQANSPHNRRGDLVLFGIPRLTALHPYRLCVPGNAARAFRAVCGIVAGQLWDGCTFTCLLVCCGAREGASLARAVNVGERCTLGEITENVARCTLVDNLGYQAFTPAVGKVTLVISVRLFRSASSG